MTDPHDEKDEKKFDARAYPDVTRDGRNYRGRFRANA